MIITRTPFRLPLGGGSTDLRSYYEKYGGFIFGVTVNKYMYIGLNRPVADDLIRLKYFKSETVDSAEKLEHFLAKEALRAHGVSKAIEVISWADMPDGTGMGTSGSYLVGLLHALKTMRRDPVHLERLADEACRIFMDILKWPEGKQDPYLATFGGFTAFTIAKNGSVTHEPCIISKETADLFERNTLLFYTGERRSSHPILASQGTVDALAAKHKTKEIGLKIFDAFKSGDLERFGRLLHEHWEVKKSITSGISNSSFDNIYALAREAGALGGKLIGAGGGGLFMFYCDWKDQRKLREIMAKQGLREIPFRVDFEGTKVITNNLDSERTQLV